MFRHQRQAQSPFSLTDSNPSLRPSVRPFDPGFRRTTLEPLPQHLNLPRLQRWRLDAVSGHRITRQTAMN